jgi:hypothetical protein
MSFYVTTVSFKVLSDRPIPAEFEMHDIVRECEEGDFVADYSIDPSSSEQVTGKQMADALYAAGSDPGFFNLDDNGNKMEDS